MKGMHDITMRHCEPCFSSARYISTLSATGVLLCHHDIHHASDYGELMLVCADENAATAAVNTAAATGTAVLDAVGLGHAAHAEERTGKQLPVDATASAVKTMDSEGLAVFEDEGVRHAVLVKINQLAMWVLGKGCADAATTNATA